MYSSNSTSIPKVSLDARARLAHGNGKGSLIPVATGNSKATWKSVHVSYSKEHLGMVIFYGDVRLPESNSLKMIFRVK